MLVLEIPTILAEKFSADIVGTLRAAMLAKAEAKAEAEAAEAAARAKAVCMRSRWFVSLRL